ncbi:hypothetical protein A2W24_03835 [Microgenomates group bacterium RBG_16_45_19]|nr:MAG: hypothetical protein A2W24_03835 [Microgenomates group bacterium RBG_16_45_19]
MTRVLIKILGAGGNMRWKRMVVKTKQTDLLGLLKSVKVEGEFLDDIVIRAGNVDFPFRYMILLNNRNISSLWELGTKLKDSDILTVFQPITGG